MDHTDERDYITHNGITYEPFIIIARRTGAKAHGESFVDQFYARYLIDEGHSHHEVTGMSAYNALAHLDDAVCEQWKQEFNQGAP